jgi:hypothetical protein
MRKKPARGSAYIVGEPVNAETAPGIKLAREEPA